MCVRRQARPRNSVSSRSTAAPLGLGKPGTRRSGLAAHPVDSTHDWALSFGRAYGGRDTPRTMSRENEDVVRLWWARFNERGTAPLDLCDEQIELRNPPEFPITGPWHGH